MSDEGEAMTQCERLLDYLNENGTITRGEAFDFLGIAELAARINELERRGYRFERERRKVPTRFAGDVWVTEYSLPIPYALEVQ